MKKRFPTFLDIAAEKFDRIVVSAEKRGLQVEMEVNILAKITKGKISELVQLINY